MYVLNVVSKLRTESLILPDDYKACYDTIMYVLKDLLNLRSDNDIKISKDKLEELRIQNDFDLDCTWKKLKPRSVKNHILMNFSINQIKKYNKEE